MMMWINRLAEILGWLTLTTLVLIGVPPFLHMPLWADATLYDTAAFNLSTGGVLYRDVFDTNLPGMVWLHWMVRSLLGYSMISLRIVDLLVFTGIITLILGLLRRVQVGRSGQVWCAAGLVGFYVYLNESCHVQRDVWMLLPSLLAVRWRIIRLATIPETVSPRTWFRGAVGEGMLWAVAFWIKPHVAIPVIAVWLTSLRLLRSRGRSAVWIDLGGILLGGLILGLIGVAGIALNGAIGPMREVFLEWNPGYYTWTQEEMLGRLNNVLMYFAPWSLVHVMAVPVAILTVIRRSASESELPRRMLAGLYLGWLIQAALLQRSLHYVHAPTVLLAIGVLTSMRIPAGAIFVGWGVLAHIMVTQATTNRTCEWIINTLSASFPQTCMQLFPPVGIHNYSRLDRWSSCWTLTWDPERTSVLGHLGGYYSSTNWVELERIATHLETLNLQDGDLIAWNDGLHPLYIRLGLRPSFRFMHVSTSVRIRGKRDAMRHELLASPAKFIVTDMYEEVLSDSGMPDDPTERLKLPPEFPEKLHDRFPWNQPIVFRSGRYFVHRIVRPIGKIDLTPPGEPDEP